MVKLTRENKWKIIDTAVPAEVRVGEKESEEVEKYCELKRGTGRLWKLNYVEVVLVVIGAIGSVT